MQVIMANAASDAVQNLTDAVTKSTLTGWDVLAAVLVLVLCIPLSRLAARATRRAVRKVSGLSDELVGDAGRFTEWLVYLVGVAVALSILGISVGFVSIIVLFALVIGALMLKPMVENSASGMLLLARPSFSVGDQIQSTEFRGVVEEIGSRSTVLRTSDGIVIHVSNNEVLSNPILVYSASESRKTSFDLTVSSDVDLDAVTTTLSAAVASVDDIATSPGPSVEATGLAENAITLSISYWYPSTMTTDSGVTDQVIRATQSALTEAGIVLSGPSLQVTGSSPDPDSSSPPAKPVSSEEDTKDDSGG